MKFQIRINDYTDRKNVVSALAEAGYSVHVEERERKDRDFSNPNCDMIIVITGCPELPLYKGDEG